MAITLAELKTRVNDRRRDITNSFISDDEITRYLNEGLRQLQFENDWDFTSVSASISYVDGTQAYALSAIGDNDFKEPIQLFYTKDFAFTYVSPQEFDALSAQSLNVYAIDGDFLKIVTNFGTQTLTLDYYSNYMAKTSGGSKREELSDSTDEPLLPNIYRDILVDYSMIRIGEKEGRESDIITSQNSFNRRLARIKERYVSRAEHIQIVISNPRSYERTNYEGKEDPLRTAS